MESLILVLGAQISTFGHTKWGWGGGLSIFGVGGGGGGGLESTSFSRSYTHCL
jgi:hypothetical protein